MQTKDVNTNVENHNKRDGRAYFYERSNFRRIERGETREREADNSRFV